MVLLTLHATLYLYENLPDTRVVRISAPRHGSTCVPFIVKRMSTFGGLKTTFASILTPDMICMILDLVHVAVGDKTPKNGDTNVK